MALFYSVSFEVILVCNRHFTSTSWKTSCHESICGCGDWGRTYSVGDFYFIDSLKRGSVEENQLPVSLVFPHRRPRHNKLVIWAETAVSPNGGKLHTDKINSYAAHEALTTSTANRPLVTKLKSLTWKSSWLTQWLRSQVSWSCVYPMSSECHHLNKNG